MQAHDKPLSTVPSPRGSGPAATPLPAPAIGPAGHVQREALPRPQGAWRLRVLLADDHAILREGLATLVDTQPDMEVVAQARGGREALQLAESLQPDVVVLDVSMPDMSGADVAEQLRSLCPDTKVLALTRHTDPGYLRRLVNAGALGYVVKRAASDTLLGAIRSVAEGSSFVDPSMAGSLISRSVLRHERGDTRAGAPLSEREEQVLRLIAWGKSNKEVATYLGISIKTAEFYKASALEKLQLRTRTDILRYALAQGWLADEDDPE